MATSETKVVTISVDLVVPSHVSSEALAEKIGTAMRAMAPAGLTPIDPGTDGTPVVNPLDPDGPLDISQLVIRTIPHFDGINASGYDNRLWEKATC